VILHNQKERFSSK